MTGEERREKEEENVRKRVSALSAFLDVLEDALGRRFNLKDVEERLLLQKYVYIARLFGFDLGYHFNFFIYGPFSEELAQDLRKLKHYRLEPHPEYASSFKAYHFKKLVKEKDEHWITLAATIVFTAEKNPEITMGELADRVAKLTKCTVDQVIHTYDEVKEYEKIRKEHSLGM